MTQSPHLESYLAKGWEVLLLTDPADEFVVDSLGQYKGKMFQAIDKVGAETDAIDDAAKAKYQPLLDLFKAKVPGIKDARLTKRLKESAVCLMTDEDAHSANMQRLLQRMGREKPGEAGPRVLEVNADHAVIQALEAMREKSADDPRLEVLCQLLYDQAVIGEGGKVQDPAAFSKRLNDVLVREMAK